MVKVIITILEMDGGASISVRKMNGNDSEYRQLKKQNVGFCGYDWMIDSIIVYDEIKYNKH